MKYSSLWRLVIALSLLSIGVLFAQGWKVRGTIVSKETGEPLPGANVVVKGTQVGTTTDLDGAFILTITDFDEVTLVVSYIGYKTVELPADASSGDLTIKLSEDVLKTSEVVVTGLATTVKRANLANAVATISAKELLPVPAQTLERALSGKFAGISVSQNTGAPGGGINVNLRGITTIEGSTQPLYVVDGVIVNDAANQSGIDLVSKATGAGSANPQGQPTNRIADINPEDIESVEVLKGASAAAVYGAKATNGVIIITTKKGKAGKTQINVSQQTGFSSILRKIGARRFTAATAEEAYGAEGLSIFNQNGGKFIDYEDVLYGQKGVLTQTTISARGGTERTKFYISGLVHSEDGIIKKTGYNKYAVRLNLDQKISERASLSLHANYIRSKSDRGITGNDNTNTSFGFSWAFTPSFLDIRPKNGVYPNHPFNPSNPIQTRDFLRNREEVNRYIISSKFNFNLYKSERQTLDFIAQGGVDFYNQENKILSPSFLQFEQNSDLPGSSLLGETKSTNSNLYLNLVHHYATASRLLFTTTSGIQFENANSNNILNWARGVIPTQSNVDQAASVNAFQTRIIHRERGFFVQEEVDIQEKFFLTAGLRGDASSSMGNTERYFFFPKFSGSIRVSKFDFWKSEFFPEMKLRAAFGQTGNLPPANAKFTALFPSNIGGKAGLLPQTRRGNSGIKPEITKEFETGLDLTFLRGKGTMEFTYYRQSISDLFLIAALPPSSGFTSEFINGGRMRTQGVEVSVGITPVQTKNLSWLSRVNFYHTDSKITALNVDPFNKGGFATFLGTYRIQKGLSPTAIIGSDVDANGKRIILGDGTPDFIMSFYNNIKIKNFELDFLWEWRQGGDIINLGKLLTDLGATSFDYDQTANKDNLHLPSNSTIDLSTLSDNRLGAARLALLGQTTAPFVESGTYLKLREVSLTYSIKGDALNRLFAGQISYLRLGAGARNLLMFTGYDGYDPEVSQFGNVAVGSGVDTIPFPSSRTYYFNISFGL